jgi:capsular exopolysaccharide synthesis family protein
LSRDFAYKAQDVLEVDLKHFFHSFSRIWLKALILCVAAATAGFLFSRFTYVPSYTSHTTFVVSNKTVEGSKDTTSLTISDISASNALANTFKYILLSDEAMLAVIDTCGLTMSVDRLKGCISITPVPNTNILEMKVVTSSAVLSRDIADNIIDYYPDVLERTLKYASLEVLNPPRIAQTPDSYNGSITWPLLGFLLSFFGSCAFVYLHLALHNTVRTVSDMTDRLGINVLGSIPRVRSAKARDSSLLMTDKANGFAFTESYKALRTKVEQMAEKKGYKSFVVTSALESEGKTTAAVNLAIALAGNGKKVLLIDADLRRPAIYNMLGRKYDLPPTGLDRVLTGETVFEAAVSHIRELGLSVLLNVHEIINSSELLSSARMHEVISRATAQYDFIIIDSSPASVLTDSVVLTSYTDAVLLAVRQDYAGTALIAEVAKSLSDSKAEFIGCLFSIVADQGHEYGSIGYSKYKRYGKYENQANDKKPILHIIKRFTGKR